MPAQKNADNVRIYGGLDDAVWIAPLGTVLPTDLVLELPSPWVELGWLAEDGIPLSMTTDVQSFRGHQGGSLLRRKVVSTEKGISFTALEESLKTRLLIRRTKGCELTPEGEVFSRAAERFYEMLRETV